MYQAHSKQMFDWSSNKSFSDVSAVEVDKCAKHASWDMPPRTLFNLTPSEIFSGANYGMKYSKSLAPYRQT